MPMPISAAGPPRRTMPGHRPVGGAMSEVLEPGAEELLQFLYLLPVAALRFRRDGTIEMLNPLASQLLMPLLRDPPRLENIYDVLQAHCPELRAQVQGFAPGHGTVIEQRNIDCTVGRQVATLSLTVTRAGPDGFLAVLRDVSRLNTMISFAFTPSDLLLEVDAEGRVAWAGGACQAILGQGSTTLVGQPLDALFTPRDRPALRRAILGMGRSGRFSGQLLRLATGGEGRCAVSGLAPQGAAGRLFVTIGPPPSEGPAAQMAGTQGFAREAEGWLRGGQPGRLGLFEVSHWDKAATGLNPVQLRSLKREIRELGQAAGDNLVLGELSEGRFGVLGMGEAELEKIGEALQALMDGFAPGQGAQVEHSSLELAPGGLAMGQAVQALRLVLERFGTSGELPQGQEGGLAGVVTSALQHRKDFAAIIAEGRFALHYQPVVRLGDRAVHHYEALIRPAAGPDNPTRNPQEFVTLVETLGLSVELDLAVVREALAALEAFPGRVAVNVSGRSIEDPRFEERVMKKLARIGPGRLLVELTETAEIEELPPVAGRLARLRDVGVAVCLDDFGAGSASFRYLRDLPVDYVKIDGAYVRAASTSQQGRAFIAAMQDLAAAKGAATIAEMVETEAEAALMRELGVGFGQGWLFGKPAPLALPAAAPAAAPVGKGKLERWRY